MWPLLNRQRASMRIPVLVLLFVGSCLGCDDVASLVEKVHGLLKSGAKSPEDVNLGLKIKKLSFSEDYNSLKLDALLTYRWEDSKFAFSQDNFCDKYLTVDPSSVAVMLPKLFFENTRKTQFFNETIQQVLHENGTFALNERMEVTLPCEQTNIFYPFGVTRCSLITRKAKSPSTQNTQIYWINDIAAEQNFAERNIRTEGMLRLKHVEFKEETEEHQDDTEDGILTLIMDFSQNNNKLFFTFFFPSILIVTISWLSMILGPMAITRSLMILGSFVILFLHYNSHEVFSVRVNYITPLDVWKVVTFLFVIAAFMELVIVSCMASTGRSRRLTRCCRQRKVHSKNTYTVEPLYEELNDLRSRATRTTCSCCRYSALCMDVAWLAGYAVAFAFFVFIFFTRYKDIVRWLNNVDVSDVTDLSSS